MNCSNRPKRSPFENLKVNGEAFESVEIYPVVLSLSKHSERFSATYDERETRFHKAHQPSRTLKGFSRPTPSISPGLSLFFIDAASSIKYSSCSTASYSDIEPSL